MALKEGYRGSRGQGSGEKVEYVRGKKKQAIVRLFPQFLLFFLSNPQPQNP